MKFRPGVLHGQEVTDLLNYANEQNFALPAVNVIGTNTVNAVLETAAAVKSPVIIQYSHGGAAFFAGKGLSNEGQKASILGGISGAQHVHTMAEAYGVSVILHTDHCALGIIQWVDGLLDAGEKFYEKNGYPLYSSHMLDLSEEPLHENIEICSERFVRMAKMGMTLEIELGNVKLQPVILKNSQEYIREKFGLAGKTPVNFVFHGGSGSAQSEIREAIEYGAVKMNIDTDMQWAYWDGIRAYYESKKGYLQSQIGNPEGDDKPNKKYYDPRVWLREGEKTFVVRLKQAFEDLNCIGKN
jgi:fructose-bisphosphate aldolase class II